MFGLMTPKKACSPKNHLETYQAHRIHYCGTCKTIGAGYSQQARNFLNHDAVFLAELLSTISAEPINEWQAAYQKVNQCFQLPKEEKGFPDSLRYAAATNVLLAAMKIDDKIKDSSTLRLFWRTAHAIFSKDFRKAMAVFKKEWNIDTQLLWKWVDEQVQRENTAHQTPDFYAEPTAMMTAIIFAEGAKVVGKPSLYDSFYSLGHIFGRFTYLLDAFEDLDQDTKNQQFNVFVQNKIERATQIEYLEAAQKEVLQAFQDLPLEAVAKNEFISRFALSSYSRIYGKKEKNSFPIKVKTWWQERKDYAQDFAALMRSQTQVRNPHTVGTTAYFYALLMPTHTEYTHWENNHSVFWLISALTLATLAAVGIKKLPKNPAVGRLKKRCENCGSCCEGCCKSCDNSGSGGGGNCDACAQGCGTCACACCSSSNCCSNCCDSCCQDSDCCGNSEDGSNQQCKKITFWIVLTLLIIGGIVIAALLV